MSGRFTSRTMTSGIVSEASIAPYPVLAYSQSKPALLRTRDKIYRFSSRSSAIRMRGRLLSGIYLPFLSVRGEPHGSNPVNKGLCRESRGNVLLADNPDCEGIQKRLFR